MLTALQNQQSETPDIPWKCAFAGCIGAIVAIIFDLIGNNQAPTIKKLAMAFHSVDIAFFTPLISAMLFILLGIVLPLIFKSPTMRQAFLLGLGILSTGMNAFPDPKVNPLPELPPRPQGSRPQQLRVWDFLQGSVAFAQATSKTDLVELILVLRPQGGGFTQAEVTLLSLKGQPLNRSDINSPEVKFYPYVGNYILEVASPGYGIVRCLLNLPDTKRRTINVPLAVSNVSLSAQQLVQNNLRPPECNIH